MLLALLITATASLADGGVDDAADGGAEPVLHLAAPLPPPAEPQPPPPAQQKYQPQYQPQPQPVPPPPVSGPVVTATPVPQPADAGVEHSGLWLRGAAEADLGLFPSGFGDNGVDLMTALHPVIGFGVGDDFGIELGPTFRLRLIDPPPTLNRPSDVGGVLRGADWDELSDWGQLLQSLRIAKESSVFHLRLGPARKKTLGLGHLMWRYSNQANPDYHPASGAAVLRAGPIRAEFFASDLLGARIFAGDLAWDIGGTFSADATVKDRYVLSLELVHDANLAARPFRPDPAVTPFTLPSVTLLHLDAGAVLVRSAALRWMVMGGVGVRNETSDLGVLVGTTLDANVKEIGFSTRIELRKQAGGFRHGFFGATYELQRFVDIGYRGPSLGAAVLPDGLSVFGELRVGIGDRISFDAAAEYFFWNRLDLDGGLSIALMDDWFFLTARTTIVGLAQQPRFALNAGLRWRLFPSFYVLAEGGTLFFPQADGSLIRGVSASAGVGVDFER